VPKVPQQQLVLHTATSGNLLSAHIQVNREGVMSALTAAAAAAAADHQTPHTPDTHTTTKTLKE
jgi:hypothetical protein